jgi:hypothetical protein
MHSMSAPQLSDFFMHRKSTLLSTNSGWTAALIMGLLAFVLSASRINHGLVDSSLPTGPGLTTDEGINVRQSVFLFEAFEQHGPTMLLPGTSEQVYGAPEYLPDHVPLGRFLLGASHEMTSWCISGAEFSAYNVPAARLASSSALALTVILMVLFCCRRYGTATAVLAAFLLMLMPRVVGHSRIASLETITTLAWFAALFPLLSWWTSAQPPRAAQAALSGIMWGILMLVKIQAVFLPPVITLFAFVMFSLRAFIPLSIMAIIGLTVFFCGWPWLWLDPVANTSSYLMSTTERLTINNWYLDQRFADKATPWHYPIVMLAMTLPLHASAGVALRCLQQKLDAAEWLLALSVVVPVSVFSIPGVPVYDGVRLFLFVMPAIAILSARGLTEFLKYLTRRRFPAASEHERNGKSVPGFVVVAACLLLAVDVAFTIPQLGPFAADAWNNARRLTSSRTELLESCYWGDGLNDEFWEKVPEGSTVAVAPVLHGVLLQDMEAMIPVIRQRDIKLEPFYYDPQKQRGLVLLVHRLADLPPLLRQPPKDTSPIVEVRLDGKVLAQLIDTSETTWQEKPEW